MKKLTFFLFAIVLTAQLYSQQQVSQKEQAAHQTIIKFFDALSDRDPVSLKNYSTADIRLYEYGQVWDMDSLILKAITQNQSADFKRTNTFDFINTAVDKTMAWVTYRLQSEIIKEGKRSTAEWLETVVLIKERKQWKVKHLHSTLIKRS